MDHLQLISTQMYYHSALENARRCLKSMTKNTYSILFNNNGLIIVLREPKNLIGKGK